MKPFESPEFRFGLLGGGVEFGESDMVVLEGADGEKPRDECRVVPLARPGVREDSVRGGNANPFFPVLGGRDGVGLTLRVSGWSA